MALRVARPLDIFNTRRCAPFITLLNGASNCVLRAASASTPTARVRGGRAAPRSCALLIAQARAGGKLDPGEAGMLSGVFHLHEQEARQVMTPIPAVVTVDISEDVETALRRCISSGHTRLLVTEDENQDRVRGIVHANSLARLLMTEGARRVDRRRWCSDAPIVPETKPLDDLLADLQRERSSMAVVIDEYGRVAGIVTVEDIIEEVVGEIDDETDPAGGDDPPAGQRRLVRPRPRRGDRPQRLRPRAAGRHRRLQLGRRLRLRRSSAGCPSAATPSRPTATRSASSRCARTASRRSASASGASASRRGRRARRTATSTSVRRKFLGVGALKLVPAGPWDGRRDADAACGTAAPRLAGGSGWVHPASENDRPALGAGRSFASGGGALASTFAPSVSAVS